MLIYRLTGDFQHPNPGSHHDHGTRNLLRNLPVVFRLHVQMGHKSQPGSKLERHSGRFFVGHPPEFAEEVKRFVTGELFDETIELRTVSSHLVDLRGNT